MVQKNPAADRPETGGAVPFRHNGEYRQGREPQPRASAQTGGGGKHPKQNQRIALIVGCAAVIIVVLALVLVNANKGITFSATDYVTVKIQGLNSEGAASLSFNEDALLSDLTGKKTLTDAETLQVLTVLADAEQSFSVSQETGLSNGDKIKVESNFDTKLLSDFGVKLKNGSLTVEVSGLKDIQEVNLLDYVRMEFSGYDGAGYVSSNIDTASLQADLLELAEASSPEIEASEREADIEECVYWVYLDGTVPEHLSNGDEVQKTVSYYGSSMDEYGIRFTGGTYTGTAEGLLEPEEIDLTEAVKVSFSGVCPNVLVQFEVDREVPYYYATSLSGMGAERITASNGDTYTLEISYDADELLELGYVAANNTAEYEISGLNDYRLNLSGTGDENLLELSAYFESNISARIADWEDRFLEAAGESDSTAGLGWTDIKENLWRAQLQIAEGESDTDSHLILVYRIAVPVLHLDRSYSQVNAYYLVCCYDVEQTPDGKLAWDSENNYWDGTLYLDEGELESDILNYSGYLGENVQVTELTQENEAEDLSLEELQAKVENSAGTSSGTSDPDAGSVLESGTDGAAAITWEGHRYIRFDESMTWDEAEKYCESLTGEDGGTYHLATITSDEEMQVIYTLIEDAPYERYWLGASDAESEGDWKWVTGEAFDWQKWDYGQPDNDGGNAEDCENYLETGSRFDYEFNDIYNSLEADHGFIAEWESQDGTAAETVYLTNLTPASCYNAGEQSRLQDPYGNLHFCSLYLDGAESSVVTYELDGAYTALEGNFSTWTEAESSVRFSMAIWGDNELLYAGYDYQKTDAPVAVSLDLTGVQTLKIQADAVGETYNGYLFLNECKLTKAEEPVSAETETEELSALWLLASSAYSNGEAAMYSDPFGYFRRDMYWLDAEEDGYAAWRLGGAYTQMDAVVMAGAGSYSDSTALDVKITADGETLWEQEMTIFDGPAVVSLDLTGKEKLEISAASKDGGSAGNVYLADTVLTKAASGESDGEESAALTAEPSWPDLDEASIDRASASLEYSDAEKHIRYYLFEEPMTWVEASEFCLKAGGHLAQPMTAQENETIRTLLNYADEDECWLGGQMIGSDVWIWSGGSQDGQVFRKADGTDNGFYTNWEDGEPNNYDGAENLLTIYYGGTWNDAADQELPFVMQVDETQSEALAETEALLLYWNQNGTADGYQALTLDGVYYPYGALLDASGGYSLSYNTLPVTVGEQSISPKTLKGVLCVDSSASVYADINVCIFGDGELLYECASIGPKDDMIPFEVNIDGVQNLVISADNLGEKDNGIVYFGYLALCGSSESAGTVSGRLSELVQVDSSSFDSRSGVLFRDLYGEAHDGYVALDGEEGGYVVYNLGSGASVFSGTLTAGGNTAYKEKTSVRIYDGDGNLLYEKADFSAEDGAAEFSVDITGVTVLRIETGGTDESYGTLVYLTDDKLSSPEA